MKIGLLSDTHGWLDPDLESLLAPCHEVWHAGDIGHERVTSALQAFKPVRAVWGNVDGQDLRQQWPEEMRLNVEGQRVWMIHIGGHPQRWAPHIKRRLVQLQPSVFICGHSHTLRVERVNLGWPMWYINPGAAGRHGFHRERTALRFDLSRQGLANMELLKLGPRSERHTQQQDT